jgi:CubicO group peptidase (beta-lactamase class C family)
MMGSGSTPTGRDGGRSRRVGSLVLARRDAIKVSLASLVTAATTAIAPAATIAASPKSAPSVEAKIDALVSAQIRDGITPGIALAISKHGQIIHTTSAGMRDLRTQDPMLTTTPQHIGSITKQFTAACILLLQQRGKLSIDHSLSQYVPEAAIGSRVTLRQMLNMDSGISDDDPAIYGKTLTEPIARPAMLANLNKLPLMYSPGSRMNYTNTNYNLLGLIVERLSGKTYLNFLHEHIFDPLGMKSSSTMDVPPEGIAAGYHHERPGQPFLPRPEMSNDFAFGTGNIVSTPLDLLAWDAGLLSGRVLGKASLREMFSVPGDGKITTIRETDPRFPIIKHLSDGGPTIYAMGWMLPNTHTRWHGGHTFLFQAANVLFSDGYAIAAAGNVRDGGAFSPENLAVEIHNLLSPGLTLPPVFVVERPAKPESDDSETL